MKFIIPLTVFVIFFSLISFSVYSTEYDTNEIVWYFTSGVASPVQSIHACTDDGEKCASVVYDYIGDKVDIFIHENPHGYDYNAWCSQYPSGPCSKTPSYTLTPTHGLADIGTWSRDPEWSNWHLPIGVTYWDGYFYVWEWGKIYKTAINGTYWSYDDILLANNIQTFSGQPTSNKGYLYAYNTNNGDFRKYWIENKTFTGIAASGLPACIVNTLQRFVWFYAETPDGSARAFNFTMYCNIFGIGVGGQSYTSNMPTSINWSHYYLDGKIIGSIEGTGTEGIYTVDTSDFTTYTSPTLYYAYNTSVNEDINTSWGLRTDYHNIYQFDRFRNTTSSDINDGWGEIFNVETLSSVVLKSYYLHSCIGLACQRTLTNINMKMGCEDFNYSTANFFTNVNLFNIPCSTNVSFTTSTVNNMPQFEFEVFNLTCLGSQQNLIELEHRPIYDLPFIFHDAITFEPISGVTTTLNAIVKTTDSYGRAVYNVNPLTNANFTLTSSQDCTQIFTASGDARQYSLKAEHPEYETSTDSFTLSLYPQFVDYYLDPKGINIIVRIFREDGQEIDPDNTGITRIFGANTTYWYTFEKRLGNIAWLYPANFLLIDNRSYFDVNLTFEFAEQTYTTFKHDGIEYTSFNVSQDETYTFIIEIPATDQPCEEASDCLPSYCDVNTFYALGGCFNNICTYIPTVCDFFCDNNVGCYVIKTTQVCNTTFDCDSVCTGNYTAEIGFCGEDGLCVRDQRVCTQPCEESVVELVFGNKTIGMCPEIFGCYILGAGAFQTFQLDVKYTNGIERRLIDTTYRCALDTAGTSECIEGVSIPTATIDVVGSIPVNWINMIEGANTVFQDVSVSCSQGCNITYEFCQYGCNPSTKTCNSEPSGPTGAFSNIIAWFTNLWVSLFPTIVHTSIMWLILSMIIAGLFEFSIGGRFGRGMGVIFGIIMIGMMSVGGFAGQMPFEIIIIFTLLSGFLVWRMWNQTGIR